VPVAADWEHINLTGDYIWNYEQDAIATNFRPLRLSPQYRIACLRQRFKELKIIMNRFSVQ
jgi:hypothetical protein